MTGTTLRVMLVDDHVLVREGLRHVLGATPGVEVVAEAGDGEMALTLAREAAPDVVVLDLSLPGAGGLEVTTRLREALPAVRVLILSVHDHPEYVLGAVRAVARGESYFSPPVARHLSAALRGDTPADDAATRLARLTPREREVLAGIASGDTSRAIATRLGLSPRTVETYRENLARKLDIKTVAGLTRFAIEAGLAAPPEE